MFASARAAGASFGSVTDLEALSSALRGVSTPGAPPARARDDAPCDPPAPPAAHATTTPLPWGKSPLRGASPGSDQWAPPPTHPAAADREKHHHGAGKEAPPRTSPVSVLMIPALELSVDLESSRDEDDGVDATMEWHRSSSNAEADALAAASRGPSATAMDFDGATFRVAPPRAHTPAPHLHLGTTTATNGNGTPSRDDALVQPRSAPRKSARPLKRELSLGRPRFAGFDDVAGEANDDAGDRGDDDDAMATGGEELFGDAAFDGTIDARGADDYSESFGVAAGETTSDDLDLDAPFVLRRDRDDRDGDEGEENGGGFRTASDRFFDATNASTPRPPRRDGARDDAFGDFERTSNGLRTLANDAPPPLRAPEKRGRRTFGVDGSDSESSGDGVDRALRRADSLAETKILAQTHLARTNSVRAPDRAQAFGSGFGCDGGVSASAHARANGRGVGRAATPFLNASASFKENRPPELDLRAFAAETGDVRLDAFAASRSSSARPSSECDDTAPPTGSGRQPHLAAGGPPAGFGTQGCPSPVDFRFHDHFDFVTIFGRSPTSEVWLARSKASGVKYCVKRVVAQFRTASERDRYVHEVEAVTFLPPHENVVKYYRAWQEDRHFYAQTELCECGSFGGCLRRAREMERLVDERDAWAMAAQVARGLAHCHRYGVTHLDVKPDNVFLTRDGTYKIGDFGVAHVAGSGWEVQDGDGDYVAPEILNQNFSNEAKRRAGSSASLLGAADVFSLGATLYEAAAGRAPPYEIRRGFAGDDDQNAGGGEGRPPALGSSVALPAGRSAELAAVIEACTRRNPEARPSAADVAAHAEMILERFEVWTPGEGARGGG